MRIKSLILAGILFAFSESPAQAQNIDCSVIKNNPASRARCEEGQREAAKYDRERRMYERRARLRDVICVVDSQGGKIAALRAGWPGRIVYEGTRAAADAISNGASSCPK